MIVVTHNHTATTLSPDELECLKMTADGHIPNEIGLALALTEDQVLLHLTSVETRLGARNQLHAIVIAMRLNLIK